MNEYRVERINDNHRNRFADLFSQCNFFRDEKTEPVLFMALRNQTEMIPVGFIQLYSNCSPTNVVKTTIVYDLYVLPDYRQKGIALNLIEVAVKFAIKNKSTLIQLETEKDNLIAQKLFESVGFKSQSSASELNVYSIQFEFD
ncbi:MAG TPA: GNAT family N-acetyltransferase [Puia sp.]|jgi:ribosomal protein S18 acetylase RimI-like enzyme|nr:GNAT family N-acetyltransferase [Puia sp.]